MPAVNYCFVTVTGMDLKLGEREFMCGYINDLISRLVELTKENFTNMERRVVSLRQLSFVYLKYITIITARK